MIKARKFWWTLLLAATALISACEFFSDGGTEIPNELTGNLYLSGGDPAVNAEVSLYPVEYVPGTGGSAAQKQTTRTNNLGSFSFQGLVTGKYNLLSRIGMTDSLFSFSDSIQVSGRVKVPSDTLKRPGSLTGKIKLDTTDDPRTATVQVVGTDYFGLVDSNGIFTLKNIAQGDYQLRVVTTLPDYAPAVQPVTIQSGQNDTLDSVIAPVFQKHFPVTGSTVALWTFDSYAGNNHLRDFGANGFHLVPSKTPVLETSPFGYAIVLNAAGQSLSVPNNPILTVGGTGKITYEVRIFLQQYPSPGNYDEAAFVLGLHEGLKLLIGTDGSLMAGTQKQAVGGTYSYAPSSAAGIVPMNRWVDVAVALDQGRNQCYAYIDGIPVQLTVGFVNGDPFRVSTSVFTVGNDSRDNQQFIGKIDEIRVSNALTLGIGLPLKLK